MITKFKAIITSSLLLGTMVFLSSCNEELEVVQTINEEFSGITEIKVESGFLDVVYEGVSDQSEVYLNGLLESSRSGKFKIEYKIEGSILYVELEQNGPFGGGRNRGNLYLTGPRHVDLEIESGSGKVNVSGVEFPELEFSAGSGYLEVEDIQTQILELEVGSGNIKATRISGNVEVEAGSGNITLQNIDGNVRTQASSGNIELKDIKGTLNSEMSSGRLFMNGVDEIQGLRVSSGLIEGLDVGLGSKTNLVSSSGNIQIRTFSNLQNFNFDLQGGSGRLAVGESASSGSLKINNGSTSTVRGQVSSGNLEIKN